MTDDPFALLRIHARAEAGREPSLTPDDLLARILDTDLADRSGGTDGAGTSAVHPPRRWRLVPVAAVTVLAVGAGAVAAAVVASRRIDEPAAGVACRSGVEAGASATVLALGDDPVGQCAALWTSGQLSSPGWDEAGSAPPLIACAGSGGGLEVLPALAGESCSQIGLADADVAGAVHDPVVSLQQRLTDELTVQRCLGAAEARAVVAEALDQAGMVGWTIEVVQRDDGCAIATVEATRRVVVVSLVPRPTE